MRFIIDLFDNRELSIIIWLGVFFIWALTHKKVRKSFIDVVNSITQRVVLISFVLMFSYIGLMIYFFYIIGFWDISYLSETLLWIFGVAFIMFININHVYQDNYYRNTIIDNLKFVVVLEFLINLYVFDLWFELILVPILALMWGMLGLSSTNPKYKQVETCLTTVLSIIGFGFIIYTLFKVIIDFSGFASIYNLKELLIPILFTVAFLPFVYFLAVYITYDSVFSRIRHKIKNSTIARYAKIRIVIAFHLNIKLLRKWMTNIILSDLNTREDINRAIHELKTMDT